MHVVALDPMHVLLPGTEAFPGLSGVRVVFRQQFHAIEDEGRGDVLAGGCGRGAGALEFTRHVDDALDGPGQGIVHGVLLLRLIALPQQRRAQGRQGRRAFCAVHFTLDGPSTLLA